MHLSVCHKLGHSIKLFNPIVWPWLTHPPCTHTLSESLSRFSNPAIQYPSLYSLSPLLSSFHPSFMKRFPLLLLISPSFVSLHILCPFQSFEITHPLCPVSWICSCALPVLSSFLTPFLPFDFSNVHSPQRISSSSLSLFVVSPQPITSARRKSLCNSHRGAAWPPSLPPLHRHCTTSLLATATAVYHYLASKVTPPPLPLSSLLSPLPSSSFSSFLSLPLLRLPSSYISRLPHHLSSPRWDRESPLQLFLLGLQWKELVSKFTEIYMEDPDTLANACIFDMLIIHALCIFNHIYMPVVMCTCVCVCAALTYHSHIKWYPPKSSWLLRQCMFMNIKCSTHITWFIGFGMGVVLITTYLHSAPAASIRTDPLPACVLLIMVKIPAKAHVRTQMQGESERDKAVLCSSWWHRNE